MARIVDELGHEMDLAGQSDAQEDERGDEEDDVPGEARKQQELPGGEEPPRSGRCGWSYADLNSSHAFRHPARRVVPM